MARAWKAKSITWVLPGSDGKGEANPFVDGVEVPKKACRIWTEDFDWEFNKGQRLGERKRILLFLYNMNAYKFLDHELMFSVLIAMDHTLQEEAQTRENKTA